LHDIAGIDAPGNGLIEPQIDHPSQSRPVAFPKRFGSRWISLCHARQQALSLASIRPHCVSRSRSKELVSVI
jgi:hypothetical protein